MTDSRDWDMSIWGAIFQPPTPMNLLDPVI